MGGGPENPIIVKDEHAEDIKPLNDQISAINIDSDSETEAKAPIKLPVAQKSKHKQALMRELKALGVKAIKPDYTKELDEPSWGDESEEDETYAYDEPEVDEYEFKEMDESDDDVDVKDEEDSDVEMKWED